ncbi:MAG: alpha/beta hydrolase [Bacteroidales bacterium]|nr:alpha/beta hydrolase [Bacteroidales bacterium]
MKRLLILIAATVSAAMCTTAPKTIPDAFKGTWHGQLELAGLSLVLHLDDSCTVDSPDQEVYGMKARVKSVDEESISISFEPKARFTGRLQGDSLVGKFTQYVVASMPLVLTRGPLVRNRPQTPEAPFPYQTEAVSIPNGDVTLAGTLCLPGNLDSPVVVMVSGSGKQDRDETLLKHKPFAVIADALARNGIPSLRYDDRECGGSTGVFADATTADFASDAASAVRYLRGRGFGKVGLIGHSEGGTIAFMLAGAETPDEGTPDFIISLAGMADRGDSTLIRQTARMAVLNGAPESAAEFAAKLAYKKTLKSMGKWGAFFASLDPAPYIARISCPVLALNGDKDSQVIPEYNLSKIEALCPQADCRLYPDLNHLFQHCKTGLGTEYGTIEETISEEVLADMIDWIGKAR